MMRVDKHRTWCGLALALALSAATALSGCAGRVNQVASRQALAPSFSQAAPPAGQTGATTATGSGPAVGLGGEDAATVGTGASAGGGSSLPGFGAAPPSSGRAATIRGQAPSRYGGFPTGNHNTPSPGSSDHMRYPMQPSGAAASPSGSAGLSDVSAVQPVQYNQGVPPAGVPDLPPPPGLAQPGVPFQTPVPMPSDQLPTVPLDVYVEETRTGRVMFGVGINSDAGVTGQFTIDERNFDITRFPRSLQDFGNGTAFRGGGQGFRFEATPGSQVQRYLLSLNEPYLFGTNVSFNISGYFFDRRFFDWDEQRLGGRVALGYRLTPDLSLSAALRAENVNIHDPRILGVPELDQVLGDNTLASGRLTLAHDTRDRAFGASQGHLIELSGEQAFGSFDYPRAELDLRQHFLVRQRPDGSGRHSLSATMQLGFTGSQTPVYENFFAGGTATLRGFDFRGASPLNGGVIVGGEFRLLGSLEYLFPVTADDMIKAVVFVDYGTVEEEIAIDMDDFRVAPGFGLRINVPALGPAPLALDFAFPVAKEATDDTRVFSFSMGAGRG